ncbi:endolysin [Synechococcus phage S-CREM2]|nr:endolysin [Synechococcus phage S-CREM2]
MDSVKSLNQFFTKLGKEFQQVSENSKRNETLLTKLFKSETKEEKDRKKAQGRVTTRKKRATQKKKRSKLDTIKALKSVFNKLLGKDEEKKGPGLLKTILGGGAIVALLGAAAWKKFEDEVKKTVGSVKDNITGGINDFIRRITGQIDEEVKGVEDEVTGGLSEVEGEAAAANSRVTKPEAEPQGQQTQQPAQTNQEVVAEERELQDSGVTRPAETVVEETKTTEAKNTSTARRTRTTDTATKETRVEETRVLETDDTTNRETTRSTKETERELKETTSTPSSATRRSRYRNRRSGVENVTGKKTTEPTKPKPKTPAQSAAEAMKKAGPASSAPAVSAGKMTSTQKKALGVLAKYESGAAGYDAVNQIGTKGGRGVAGFSGDIKRMPQHKGRSLTDFTIKEIKALQYDDRTLSNSQWIKKGKLHAVGRYQFIGNTLPGVAKRAGVSDNDKFTPEIQDRMALQLMKERGISPWVGPSDKATSAERAIIRQARQQELPTRRQKGGAVGIATDHIKKDEALSSLTKGSNDWIREGGTSVVSSTPWSKVSPDTQIHAYKDSVGVSTIGWGSTYYDNISSGSKKVQMGDTITKKRADDILSTNVSMLSRKLSKDVGSNWSKMSDKQQASLLSMGYNAPNFLSSPTFAPKLRGAIQSGDMETAADNLEWGGPSATRISESQKMLRSGPMDLTKVETPKVSTETKTSAAKVMKQSGQKQKKKEEKKPWWRFGFQQGGFVPYAKDSTSSDTFTESGELNLNKIIDRPNFDSAPKSAPNSAPFQQTNGSVVPAGGFQQSMGSVVSTAPFMQSMGSVGPVDGFQQSMGSVVPTAPFTQSMGSVVPTAPFTQSMGSVAPAGGFQQSMGSVAPAGGFQQSMGSVAPAGGFQQSMGSVGPVDSFQQTNGFSGVSEGFLQSMGYLAPTANFQQSDGSVAPADNFQQTNGSVSRGPSFIQRIASMLSFGRADQTNGSVAPVDNFQQTNGSVASSPSFAQSMGTPSVLRGPQQSSGAASVAPAPVTAESLGLPSIQEIEKMTIQKLNTYLDPAKTGASEPRVFEAARAAKEKARQEGVKEEMEIQRLGQVAAVKAKMEVKIETARAAAQKKSVEQFRQTNGSAGKSPSFAQSMSIAKLYSGAEQTNGSVASVVPFAQTNGSVGPAGMFQQTNGSVAKSPSFSQSMGLASSTTPFAQTNGSVGPVDSFQQSMGSVAPTGGFQQSMGSVAPAGMFQQSNGSVAPTGGFQQSNGSVKRSSFFQQALGAVAPVAKFSQSMGRIGSRRGGVRQKMRGYARAGSNFVQSMGQVGESPRFSQAMGTVGNLLGSAQNAMRYQQGGSVSGSTIMGEAPKEGGIVPGSGTGDQYPISLPEGSFVLNKKATETLHRLQQGGVASISSNSMSKIEQRFFNANEVYSETMKKKKKRPVVVVDIPAPSSPGVSASPTPQSLETGGNGGLNMNTIRSKMHRVNAGSLF